MDVTIVSLGSTEGLRVADDELAGAIARAGATVSVARARPPRPRRTLVRTDLAWARAARAALRREPDGGARARALIYSTTTAALLWQRPGAVRFDATAADNRPGRHGLWQRPIERRRLAQAPLLLPWSASALPPDGDGADDHVLVVPVAIEPSAPFGEVGVGAEGSRDIAAVTYAANPAKKGLDRVLAAWRELTRQRGGADARQEQLVVTGVDAEQLRAAGLLREPEPAINVVGRVAREEYRSLLRRARVFVCAPRREDHGIAQLEALADGCQLVSTAAPGPYAALPIARELDARLIDTDLVSALRAALDDPLPGYRERAREKLAPLSRAAVDRLVVEQLLPRLLG
ncbi:MAG TPA: glycosyltransferase [Solirubrobacteraceae bacterium]|nr:glycosyltransferase [Solirubrobacteraceae bacterium]